MKTSIKLTISALLLILSTSTAVSVLAKDGQPDAKVFTATMFPAADASKLWLCLEKYQTDKRISVELLDAKGQVLFHELLPAKGSRKNTYRQQFDLSQISDGSYTFRIASPTTQTEEITFKLTTPGLQQVPNRLISLN